MAVIVGHPGQSAKEHAFVDLVGPPLATLFVFSLLSPAFVIGFSRISSATGWILTLLGMAGALWWARRDITDLLAMMRGGFRWARGANGETLTGETLSRLSDDYVVVHDFHPIGRNGQPSAWNVDHIVVGPNGVFVIDTKNYSRPYVASASESSFTRKNVAQAQGNAAELKKKLTAWSRGALSDVFVAPVVVYVQDGAYVKKPRERLVRVIPLKWLESEITKLSSRRPLTADEVLRISSVLFSQMAPHLQEHYRTEFARYRKTHPSLLTEAQEGVSAAEAANHVSASSESVGSEGGSVCPCCGGTLVQRTARQGPEPGRRFLGCSNFRTAGCRYTRNLEGGVA